MKKILASIYVFLAIASLLLSGFSCSAEKPRKEFINYEWGNDQLWDDGQAEVATYDATMKIYNENRSFEYTYILVKEDFNESFHVKSDNYQTDRTYPVMKINKFCRVETLKYPYHFLTSIFMHRSNPEALHKLSHTSQEWCGNTSKNFQEKGSKYQVDYMTYFDGMGNRSAKVDKGPWFEDQLSYTLRTLEFEDGLSFNIELYPSQVSNNMKIPQSHNASIAVEKAKASDIDELDSTLIENPWKITVTKSDKETITYWINNGYPNYLLKMTASDGRSLLIKSITRDQYWAYE